MYTTPSINSAFLSSGIDSHRSRNSSRDIRSPDSKNKGVGLIRYDMAVPPALAYHSAQNVLWGRFDNGQESDRPTASRRRASESTKSCALPLRDPAPTLPEVPLHLHAGTRLHRATALETPSIGI